MEPNDKLNRVGLKATEPRRKVLQVLEMHERRHLTADEIHRRLLEQRAHIGVATLYRVLAQLTDLGILSRHVLDADRTVYELDHGAHDHLVCLECDSVAEFSDEIVDERKKRVARSLGYALTEQRHTLFGYCARCRNTRGTG